MADPIEAAADAILAKVPLGYGMTRSEALEYARAGGAAYLRARAYAEVASAEEKTDRVHEYAGYLIELAAELDAAP